MTPKYKGSGKGIHPIHNLQVWPEEQNRRPNHIQEVLALQEGN